MSFRDWLPSPPIEVLIGVAVMLGGSAQIAHENEANRAYEASRKQYEQSKLTIPPDVTANRPYTGDKSYREEWRAERQLEACWIELLDGGSYRHWDHIHSGHSLGHRQGDPSSNTGRCRSPNYR